MFNYDIECDRCGSRNCIVSEVVVKEPAVSMAEYAKKHTHAMSQLTSYQSDVFKDKQMVIQCQDPHCKHEYRFTQYAPKNKAYYHDGSPIEEEPIQVQLRIVKGEHHG